MPNLPDLKLKSSMVKLNAGHLYAEVARIAQAAREAAPSLSDNCVVITSANDSKHKDGSLHYKDRAFDIRTWNIKADSASSRHAASRTWVAKMNAILGEDYDVILEADHIHAEYDPKET